MTEDTASDESTDESAESKTPGEPALQLNKDTLKIAAGAILGVVALVILGSAIGNQIADQAQQTGAFATVNGENITYSDLRDRRGVLAALGRPSQTDQTLKELLIDERLLLQEAESRGLIPSQDNVSASLSQLLEENQVNRSRYEQRLAQEDMNWSDLEAYYAEREGINTVIDTLNTNESVSEEELRRVYEENQESFELPERMQIRHILLTEPETGDSTEALARRLLDQARNGTDFCDLVAEHSEDPGTNQDCGRDNVSRTSRFPPAFIDAAFNMTTGEYRLVNSSIGYHILVKDGELQPETRSFESVRDQIRQQYERQQQVGAIASILDDLRANATIQVYEDSLANKSTERTGKPEQNETTNPMTNETTSEPEPEEPVDTATEDATTNLRSCLNDAGATLYTVPWSPHSQDQLDEIGDAQDAVDVVDCGEEQSTCQDANVTTYPTWTFDDGTRIEGYHTRTSIRQTLSCT